MNKAQELFDKVKPAWDKYEIPDDYKQMPERGQRDVLDKENWGYYQFLPCLIDTTKPFQVIELGGAMGVAAVMMAAAHHKPQIYSITLQEHGLEFSFIKKEYPHLHKIVGDDLVLNNWPAGIDLHKTDIWFLDSLHEYSQIKKEYELYKPFWKKGTIILLDDIKINAGMWQAWLEWEGDKYDASILHVPSGFGIVVW